jgi:hypothetical protein
MEQYVALAKGYRDAATTKPEEFRQYVERIFARGSNHWFRVSGVYREAGVLDFAELAKVFKDDPSRVSGLFDGFSDCLENEQRSAFLEKYIRYIGTRTLNHLIFSNPNPDVDKYINLWKSTRSMREQLFASRDFVGFYLRAKRFDQALHEADISYRIVGRAEYDNSGIGMLMRENELDAKKVSALIFKWIEDGGESSSVQARLKELKTWGDGEGIKIIAAHQASKGKSGKDPVLTALVTLRQGGESKSEFNKAVDSAVPAFGTNLSMRYADVKNIKDLQIQEICHHHAHRASKQKLAETWFPIIACPGEASESLINAVSDRGYDYGIVAAHLQRWFSTGKVTNDAAERILRNMRLPRENRETKQDPLAKIQSHIDGRIYFEYLMNNRGHLADEVFAPNAISLLMPILNATHDLTWGERQLNDLSGHGNGLDLALLLKYANVYFAFESRLSAPTSEAIERLLQMASRCSDPAPAYCD